MTDIIGSIILADDEMVWEDICIEEDGHRFIFETMVCGDAPPTGYAALPPHVLDDRQVVCDWRQRVRGELIFVPHTEQVFEWYTQSAVAAALAEDPS